MVKYLSDVYSIRSVVSSEINKHKPVTSDKLELSGLINKTHHIDHNIFFMMWQIKGMLYQNALFLANLESLKDRRIKLSHFSRKYFPLTAACILSCLLNVMMKSLNYVTP